MGSRSYGGSTSTEGGVNLAGNLGDPDRLGASLGFHYDQELSRSWELTRAHSAERSVQIRFPRNGALFVWMQSVKEATLGTHLASYNSLEQLGFLFFLMKFRKTPCHVLVLKFELGRRTFGNPVVLFPSPSAKVCNHGEHCAKAKVLSRLCFRFPSLPAAQQKPTQLFLFQGFGGNS